MLLHDARLRFQEALDTLRQRADTMLGEVHIAREIIDDVARYALGRVREQYVGIPTDPVAAILSTFIIDASTEFMEAKKVTAVAIADEKRLAKQVELEAKQAEEWEQRAVVAAQHRDEAVVKEAVERKHEHMELAAEFRRQWQRQRALVEDLKSALLRMNQVIEKAKCTKSRLITRRLVVRASELRTKAEQMDQIVKGLSLLTELDTLSDRKDERKQVDEHH
jgi:phage shock protein A